MVRRGVGAGIPGILIFLLSFPGHSFAGVLPGPDTVIESRILWVESQMRLSMSRFHHLFLQKNEGADFYSNPVLPPVPLPGPPSPVTGTGVSGVAQSAAEGMGQALGALPAVQGELDSGAGVHELAYKASP
ncbi:MAG: hypothetical protein D084_Lepto4C00495G0001, partial [Leptospirillum sp. Group IV 'UBA BS']